MNKKEENLLEDEEEGGEPAREYRRRFKHIRFEIQKVIFISF